MENYQQFLESKIKNSSSDYQTKINAITSDFNSKISEMNSNFNDKLDKLNKDHKKKVEELNKQIDYLKLTPAKRKKVDMENAKLENSTEESEKDGGVF